MRIAFVYPATEFDKHYHPNALPIGLLYLAAMAEQRLGASVDIFDSRHGPELPSLDRINDYDLIGFTAMSMQANTAVGLARRIREAKYRGPVVFGGPHASVAPDHLKQQSFVSAIFVGEAEETFPQYLAYLGGKPHKLERVWVRSRGDEWAYHAGEGFVRNLDELPFPARTKYGDLSARLRFINMTTTRGCPFNCNYCQPTKRLLFGSKVRRRSVDNVMEEIGDAVRQFAITSFSIDDDTFTYHKQTVLDLCERVKPLGLKWSCQSRSDIDRETLVAMRDAGCEMLYAGIESGSQRVLDMMDKRNTVENNAAFIRLCKEVGMDTWCNMMVGYPGETVRDMDLSLDFVARTQPTRVCVSQVTPFPGTFLWERHRDDVVELDWNDMARHVKRPKFRSMAHLQRVINRYMWLMTREPGRELNFDLVGKSRLSRFLARRFPLMYRILSRRRTACFAGLDAAISIAHSGDLEGAVQALEILHKRYPDETDPCGHLGWLYLSSARPRDAVRCYRKFLSLNPGDAEAHRLLAQALTQTGELNEAKRELETAIRLKPSTETSQALAELERTA